MCVYVCVGMFVCGCTHAPVRSFLSLLGFCVKSHVTLTLDTESGHVYGKKRPDDPQENFTNWLQERCKKMKLTGARTR